MQFFKKKPVQLTMVLALSAGIILAGTFAWFSFTQNALNVFNGFTNPDVNLHDDYEEGKPNKDVYVENSGERPLYVRVKLDEYMDLDGQTLIPGGVKDKTETWSTHAYLGTTVDNCGEAPHEYYDWIMGNAKDKADPDTVLDPDAGLKYYLPAPFAYRAHFTETGVEAAPPSAVTYEKNADGTYKKMYASDAGYTLMETGPEAYARIAATLAEGTNQADLAALYAALDAADTSAARKAAQDAIDAFLLEKKLGYYDKVFDLDADGNLTTAFNISFVGIGRTLTTENIYTMAEWIAAGTPTGDFWIMDTDGWCYWGNILLPGQTTGLLLSEVQLNELNKPAGRWYYGINASLQAVTYDDIAKFGESNEGGANGGGGITEQGTMLLMATSGNYAFDMAAARTGPNDPVYTFVNNKDNTYRLMTSDGSNTITYSPLFVYTGPVPAVTKGDIYHDGTAFGDPTYQVGKKFTKDIPFGAQGVEFTVATAENSSSVVEGNDGRHYIKLSYTAADGTPNKIAWLAPGANKTFDPLTLVNGTYQSQGDDVLVWTDGEKPGTSSDRTQEDPNAVYKINDTFTADGQEWMIIGKDTKESSATFGNTLVIAAKVQTVEGGHTRETATAALGTLYTSATQLKGAGVTEFQLLKVQDALDYFSDNAARAATNTENPPKNNRWWLSDGVVDVNGALTGDPAGDPAPADLGVRPAFWIESEKLETLLTTPTAPAP